MEAKDVIARYEFEKAESFSREEVGVLLAELEEAKLSARALVLYKSQVLPLGLCEILNNLGSNESIERLMRSGMRARRTPLPSIQGTYAYDVKISKSRYIILTYEIGGKWYWGPYDSEIWDPYPWEPPCTE